MEAACARRCATRSPGIWACFNIVIAPAAENSRVVRMQPTSSWRLETSAGSVVKNWLAGTIRRIRSTLQPAFAKTAGLHCHGYQRATRWLSSPQEHSMKTLVSGQRKIYSVAQDHTGTRKRVPCRSMKRCHRENLESGDRAPLRHIYINE